MIQLHEGNKMRCNKCLQQSNDISKITISCKGEDVHDALDRIDKGLFGELGVNMLENSLKYANVKTEIYICQKCVSQMYRGLDKIGVDNN